MKVIGAGFGRTGTLSLKAALEELGFGPCYHMVEVFANPHHVEFWQAAAEGKTVDWADVFSDYNATVDWPACRFYEQIMHAYPDARVLLSLRDPEKWYESVANTIYRRSTATDEPVGPANIPGFGRMVTSVVWQGTFDGQFENKEHALAVFDRHIQEVKQRVPADKLLVFDVKQGWEPLCRFLGVDVPEGSFPHLNDTAAFHQMILERTQGAAPREE
ncbi:MAG TPA: sulfotransferase [Chloroflexota bacterium]|nr:sulfotransferase [Chloroflexota bacterium]